MILRIIRYCSVTFSLTVPVFLFLVASHCMCLGFLSLLFASPTFIGPSNVSGTFNVCWQHELVSATDQVHILLHDATNSYLIICCLPDSKVCRLPVFVLWDWTASRTAAAGVRPPRSMFACKQRKEYKFENTKGNMQHVMQQCIKLIMGWQLAILSHRGKVSATVADSLPSAFAGNASCIAHTHTQRVWAHGRTADARENSR